MLASKGLYIFQEQNVCKTHKCVFIKKKGGEEKVKEERDQLFN